MNSLVKAIREICPKSEFVISGDDLDNIDWHVIEGEIPTKEKILAAVKLVEEAEKKADDQQIADRLSAISKLAALGLTQNEAKAIVG